VFFDLKKLRRGALVKIVWAGRPVAAFRVVAIARRSKNAFPTNEVYGPVHTRALRLITCGGPFDFATHHYPDNLIVYAHAVDPRMVR
jgi:hypothetical protein